MSVPARVATSPVFHVVASTPTTEGSGGLAASSACPAPSAIWLESTAKLVLETVGAVVPRKFPGLLSAAFDALHLHPKATPSTGTDLEEPIRKILSGALQITLGIAELRNAKGTGHGRAAPVQLSRRHARLAAGTGITVATLLLDTLDDPTARWRDRQRAE